MFINSGHLYVVPAEVPAKLLTTPWIALLELWQISPQFIIFAGATVLLQLFWPNLNLRNFKIKGVRMVRPEVISFLVCFTMPLASLETMAAWALSAFWLVLGLVWYSTWNEAAASLPWAVRYEQLFSWPKRKYQAALAWLGIELVESGKGEDAGQGEHHEGDDAV
jgi:hypothetical protein